MILSALILGLVWASHADAGKEPVMEDRSALIRRAFNELDRDNMGLVEMFYAPNVRFEDPIHRIRGRNKLKAYYERMYRNVERIRFDFFDEVVQDDTHVLVWKMRLEAKGLNRGEPVILDGTSVLKFNDDDKVVYHRDYFDMGELVYERVPILGRIVKRIKNSLSTK